MWWPPGSITWQTSECGLTMPFTLAARSLVSSRSRLQARGPTPFTKFRGHDKRQWERLACLPNVLYTDGESFGLYRDGERVGETVRLVGSVTSSGATLAPPTGVEFTGLFEHFLRWQPIAPRRLAAC